MNTSIKTLLFTLAGICITLLLFGRTHEFMHSALQPQPAPSAAIKIPIDPKRWYQLNNTSNGLEGLFDGVTNENIHTGYGKVLTNYDSYYPLLEGEQITIASIRFFDFEGTNLDAPFTLSIITDKWERIPIARFIGSTYNRWVGPDPAHLDDFTLKTPVSGARYLVINTSGAFPTEMELYGTYRPGKAPTAAPRPSVTFQQSAGVNAYEWNFESPDSPLEIDERRMAGVKSFSAIRHYMDWEKLEPSPGEYTFNPTISGSWNYDAIYERCQDRRHRSAGLPENNSGLDAGIVSARSARWRKRAGPLWYRPFIAQILYRAGQSGLSVHGPLWH